METFRRYEVPFEEAEVLHLWGRALEATDPERAPERYDAALEIYTSRDVGKAWIERVLSDRARVT